MGVVAFAQACAIRSLTEVPLASVEVHPSSVTIQEGETQRLTAQAEADFSGDLPSGASNQSNVAPSVFPTDNIGTGEASAQDSTPAVSPCDGMVVTAINTTPRDPSFVAVPRRLRGLARGVGLIHTTSKEGVILTFLHLEVGHICTERRRAESERILRLQPFLAAATVRAVSDSAGGVRIEVETIDEIPTVFGMRVRGKLPSALRFGNGNVGGQGLHLAASVERGFAYRTGVGGEVRWYRAFGRPYTLELVAERAPLRSALTLALGHAFFTDLQRTAWHMGYGDVNRYVRFLRPEDERPLSLYVRSRFSDVGGVRRIGTGRYSAFIGGLFSFESVSPAEQAVVVSDSGLVADTSVALAGPFSSYSNVRMNAVIGVRALSFMPVQGFDALRAVQDVAAGVQLGALVGRGLPRLGGLDDDIFLSVDLYAGLGSPRSFAALRAGGEARNDRLTGEWDSMIGSGRAAWYLKPAAAHVLIGSVEFAGLWRARVPFQLALGDRQGGVRGYSASHVAGAVRTVASIEERWAIGRLTRHGALGLAIFADAGRVWAGDSPFGVDSRTKIGVGVGLLAALPPESQRLWRLDFIVPANSDSRARWEVRLSSARAGAFRREPRDVARGRAGASPSAIFIWR